MQTATGWRPRVPATRFRVTLSLATFTAAHGVAMVAFSPFVDLLTEIEDPRRAEGKLYRLPHVVLFAILAIVAGANSYRTIHSFVDVHRGRVERRDERRRSASCGDRWQDIAAKL